MMLWIGLGLMAVGIILFVVSRAVSGGRNRSVTASNGSVAVGGNNSGTITNVSGAGQGSAGHSSHGLTVFAIVVELVGIGGTVWHVVHIAPLLTK